MNAEVFISKWEEEQELNSRCIDNPILKEVITSKKQDKITDNLARIFYKISTDVVNRFVFLNEDAKQELIQNCVYDACKFWKNFNEKRYEDAEIYLIQIIRSSISSYYYRLKKDEDHTRILQLL